MRQLIADLVARHRPAVLLVTHDVDEAILLAGRVAVLTEGRLSLDERTDLPHPRTVGSPGFANIHRRLLAELGVEETAQVDGGRERS
jgi:sulfonate transport system ATP-binding protein